MHGSHLSRRFSESPQLLIEQAEFVPNRLLIKEAEFAWWGLLIEQAESAPKTIDKTGGVFRSNY